MTEHTITLGRAARGSTSLSKVIHVDWETEWPLIVGKTESPQVTLYRFRERTFRDLKEMLSILRGGSLGGEVALRAQPIAEIGRRAVHPDPEKGPPGLVAVARAWVGFDWDNVPVPDPDTDPLLHPSALAELILNRLPPAFRNKSLIVQISASAGLKGARFRTWHILAEPLTGKNLKLWCKPSIDRGLLDPVTLVEAQPHYLGVTVIGGCDPCPERFTLVRRPGGEVVETDGFHAVKVRVEAEEKAEKLRRALIAASRPKLTGAAAETDAARAFEATLRKAEAAITGASARHPVYLEQCGRLRAICELHGHDWATARDRLKHAYLSTLTAEEARARLQGSTEGVLRWLESRP